MERPCGLIVSGPRCVSDASSVAVLNDFLAAHVDVPIVADTGDAMFASVDIRANEIVAPAYYATMGFSIPAALGLQIVSGRRPLVLVGDGAFQMTGPEISHAPEYACNPVVVLFNNSRWRCCRPSFLRPSTTAPFRGRLRRWLSAGADAASRYRRHVNCARRSLLRGAPIASR